MDSSRLTFVVVLTVTLGLAAPVSAATSEKDEKLLKEVAGHLLAAPWKVFGGSG